MIVIILLFIVFISVGVPISFGVGLTSLVGIAMLERVPVVTVYIKMFNGLNSFILLAVPLFILCANLMNRGNISNKLIDFSVALVGHYRGGLAHANVVVSMIFGGISGSSQADTAGIGKVLIPAMVKEGYDYETSVGVTAASSTLGSIIPPSILMVIYAGMANVSVGALFFCGIIPGVLIGLSQMLMVCIIGKKRNFPKNPKVPFKQIFHLFTDAFPALLTPVIIIGGIVTGFFTATEAAAIASLYSLLIGMFVYKTIKVKNLWDILKETVELCSLSLFAVGTACALGELLSYYQVHVLAQNFFATINMGTLSFTFLLLGFFLFLGTFMDGGPAIILFTPVLLPAAVNIGIDPLYLGLIFVITMAMGLVTPPYGVCLMLASKISNISMERAFKGVIPYLGISMITLSIMVFFPDIIMGIPKWLAPQLFR
jgi:tripartite ATP-independent transporter DctM subunit